MKHNFLDLLRLRRTRYDLTNQSTLPKEEIFQLLQRAVKHAPSAFNSQTTRVLLLCAGKHKQFWQLVRHELQQIVPAEKYTDGHFCFPKNKKAERLWDYVCIILWGTKWKILSRSYVFSWLL